MKKMVNLIGTSQDSHDLKVQWHQLHQYTQHLVKDTNSNLKELQSLPAPLISSDQVKDICHVWELGGGSMFPSLLNSTHCLSKPNGVTLVIMLDLSDLLNLWSTMETLINVVKNIISTSSDVDKLCEKASKRIPGDHPESTKAQILPEDPAKDSNFREPLIDALRRQKDEELDRYCQDILRREQILSAR